ncbi:MAG: ClbS/DfsB family four-helix bundle protein [Anaerolineales bacterium]|nr:ClbS/DfsB family four-helix bundle protein [Anaerolineales bacterium]
MSYKQRGIAFLENEWKTYVERFNRLPKDEGLKRVNAHGYAQFRDMLAHILAWWDEGMGIILAIAENREFERKKYDFDVFNADAVTKYKDWNEKEFLNLFETSRVKYLEALKPIDETVFDNRRVKIWINAVFIHHAREHLVVCNKFLVLDTLEHEYPTLIEKFDALEDKNEYLKKEGFERFEDILAHIIGWWDEGVKVIEGFKKDSNFVYDEPEVDSFNQKLVEQYRNADVRNIFEQKRNEMIELIKSMDESLFDNQIVERWLAADVVEHFDEHDV